MLFYTRPECREEKDMVDVPPIMSQRITFELIPNVATDSFLKNAPLTDELIARTIRCDECVILKLQ